MNDTHLWSIINHYGTKAQVNKALEELAELQVALIHFADNKCDKETLLMELADVLVMCRQIMLMYGFEDEEIEWAEDYKIKRTLKRIKEEHNAPDREGY